MKNPNRFYLIITWIAFISLSRLIPHPANITPLISLTWFSQKKLSRCISIIILLLALLLSDIGLHYLYGYAIFGSWTFFTYSGLIFIWLAATKLNNHSAPKIIYILSSSLFFWSWTNFGTWLTTPLYAKSFTGLILCYTMALPFLRNQLIGDLIWAMIIFKGFEWGQVWLQQQAKQTLPIK